MELLKEAFIFLAAGVIAVPIASRLGLGSVLGYLLAGALIGPFALGFITDAEHIMHFAEFGVVMMLFLIGLELRPALLWQLRRPILGLGGLQVALTTVLIAGIALLFDFVWQMALAIGLVLALSSTAIALQILNEKHLMKSDGGQASFAVLLFQDIAVIPIIAMLPLLATLGATHSQGDAHSYNIIADLAAWQQTLIVIAVVLAIVVSGRFLMRPLFRFIAESGLREIFTALALLLVVGIALLMNLVGLSPALGAFIAGVVLADSEYRHEIEANIDPFKALLLGLFFISVGASIDFNLLGQQPMMIGSLVLALVLIKFAILWVLAAVFKLDGGHRYWFTFALAQGGEFGFVLLSFSLQNGVLPTETVSVLTVTIALSMVLTPILMLFNERWVQPKFQQSEADMSEESMSPQENPVIIAGFGRFGQIVGRLLLGNGFAVTVLDHSATHIERVRKFGFKIYYGDATREDLLHTAGAAEARLLVVAIDDREAANEIVRIAKQHFPQLKVLVRAFDVVHLHELQALGADYIERELFLASLKMGEEALQLLGLNEAQAAQKANHFHCHDETTLAKLSDMEMGSQRYISTVQKAREELIEILREDQEEQASADQNNETAPKSV